MGNLKNAVISLLVPLPSILFYLSFLHRYHALTVTSISSSSDPLSPLWLWCSSHPILLANVLFFINVDLLFWLIGLIQSSHWMIDLYWTVIPVLLVHYYATHPFAARYNFRRSTVVTLLTWVWSIRLTHNYLRREGWKFGAREDWRFNDMRNYCGKHWWWVSFFVTYLFQQVLLIGICLPMYAIHSVDKPWNVWDYIAISICVCGVIVAYFADTQLHEFVSRNNRLKELNAPLVPTLDNGLWHYSRRPNYFGEQLWWWGLVIFGWNVGHGWTFIGSLINSLCLGIVTMLVEQRIMKQEYRTNAYRLYQKTTSVWIPWFKSSQRGEKYKNI